MIFKIETWRLDRYGLFVRFLRALLRLAFDCRHNVRGRHYIRVEGSVKFIDRAKQAG